MGVLQIQVDPASSKASAMARLIDFVKARYKEDKPPADLEAFERALQQRFTAAQSEVLGQELEKFDLYVPEVLIDGVRHLHVLRCAQTYMTTSGLVSVTRSLYSTRREDERAKCPMELRSGVVEGFWTPLAAKRAAWAVAHLTPQESEEMFALGGGMRPSRSILDQLPKQLSARWEPDRISFETQLRVGEKVPKKAVAVAVSLDGVMLAMKDGDRKARRKRAAKQGKHLCGPSGNQQTNCATLSFYDRFGKRLRTIRVGRMPEIDRTTLKILLKDELMAVLRERPDLQIVKVADGARDIWTFLTEALPPGVEIVDFYHAVEHLHVALGAAYGDASLKCQERYVKLRHVLRRDPKGADKVLRALVYLRDCDPRNKKIAAQLRYFRRNHHRMAYATTARKKLPIGSGVTEAACKTLVTQRMKRSGMRWLPAGGQAILTLRGWTQSGRFNRGWALLAATYQIPVTLPAKVTVFPGRRLGGMSV